MSTAATPDASASGVAARRGPGRARWWATRVLLALLLLTLLRALLAETFVVPSGSMAPTIAPGDRVVVLRPGEIERGDLVVFDGGRAFALPSREPRLSGGPLGRVLGGGADLLGLDLGEQDYLKRAVGIGGDRVSCTPEAGLRIDGEPLAEPYLAPGTRACDDPFDVVVPAGHLLVLGDDRARSSDSRDHLGDPGGGMVPLDDVVGRVVLRYWPLGEAGRVGR